MMWFKILTTPQHCIKQGIQRLDLEGRKQGLEIGKEKARFQIEKKGSEAK